MIDAYPEPSLAISDNEPLDFMSEEALECIWKHSLSMPLQNTSIFLMYHFS
jgi:hypothetical protein